MQSNLIGPREHFLIVDIILKCWPSMSPGKQVAFIKFLTLFIPTVEPKLSHARSTNLIKLIAESGSSPSAAVAQATVVMLVDSGLDAYIADHSRTFYPILYPVFMDASQTHWSNEVRDSAKRVLAFFSRIDPQTFREVSRSESGNGPKAVSLAKTWTTVCKMAGDRDRTLNIRGKLSEILRAFAMGKILTAPLPPAAPRKGSTEIIKPEPLAERARRLTLE
jgi:hypothetical protein